MIKESSSFYPISLASMAAIIAGILYTTRWIWELWEGILKNMNSPSLITQNFFIVKLLFIMVLLGIYKQIDGIRSARIGLITASAGLIWTSVTRTIEAYGVSGPWGLFGSPGLLLFFFGLSIAGFRLMKNQEFRSLGKLIMYILTFSFLGSISAILFFNVLGRDLQANQIASVISNLFLIAEGLGWIIIGFQLNKWNMRAKLHHV